MQNFVAPLVGAGLAPSHSTCGARASTGTTATIPEMARAVSAVGCGQRSGSRHHRAFRRLRGETVALTRGLEPDGPSYRSPVRYRDQARRVAASVGLDEAGFDVMEARLLALGTELREIDSSTLARASACPRCSFHSQDDRWCRSRRSRDCGALAGRGLFRRRRTRHPAS